MKFLLPVLGFVSITGSAALDECSQLCKLIPGSCNINKGSYCKNGHSCMDFFWFVDNQILCNETSRDCVRKREVTCAEARGIVSSNNASKLRSWQSFEIDGTFLGSFLTAVSNNGRFLSAIAQGVDRRPSQPELDIYRAAAGLVSSPPNWVAIHQLSETLERHPLITEPSFIFKNGRNAVKALLASLLASSSAMESLFSARLSDGQIINDFTVYEGFSISEFEKCWVYNSKSNQLMKDVTITVLPSIIFANIEEYSDRASTFKEVPTVLDFSKVARVQPSAGSPMYRIIGVIRPTSSPLARFELVDPCTPIRWYDRHALIYERI